MYPDAPSHKLGALVEYNRLPVAGKYHRALADAEMTASLLLCITEHLRQRYNLEDVPHELLRSIQTVPRHQIGRCIEKFVGIQSAI